MLLHVFARRCASALARTSSGLHPSGEGSAFASCWWWCSWQPHTVRGQLDLLCQKLLQIGQGNATWTKLIETTRGAIANPRVSPGAMASLVVREIKQASELLMAGKGDLLTPSEALAKLAVPAAAAAAPAAAAPAAPAGDGDQLVMARDTKAVARTLIGAFSKPQLMEIAKYLAMAAKKP